MDDWKTFQVQCPGDGDDWSSIEARDAEHAAEIFVDDMDYEDSAEAWGSGVRVSVKPQSGEVREFRVYASVEHTARESEDD